MELEIKHPDHIVPAYSLTGDLLSYLRCRLQYRYHNGSALPPSRPVQLWFGEFIHGTLELVYRYWAEQRTMGQPVPSFPWPCNQRQWSQNPPQWQDHDIGRFADLVEEALRRQGKQARSTDARDSAYRRVAVAVNELGPHLFPLIASAERRVSGTRPIPAGTTPLRCENYELHGVIDVLTHVTLARSSDRNLLRKYVYEACKGLTGNFEVIVDYKGTRRPMTDEAYWQQGDWQIQTYAWLRRRQPGSLPVAAGVLIYVNELTPGDEEMRCLQQGISNQTTDEVPLGGSKDEQLVRMWKPGMNTDQLSLDFRLHRAIRVIPISSQSIDDALLAFDRVVRRVEEDVVSEAANGDILQAWSPDCRDEATCVACDFRHFCPQPAPRSANYVVKAPLAP